MSSGGGVITSYPSAIRKEKTLMKNMLMLVSALAGAFTVFADYAFTDITVAAGETKTIESVTACKSLSVSGTLI